MNPYKITIINIVFLFLIGCAHLKTDFRSFPKIKKEEVLTIARSNSDLIRSFESRINARVVSPKINMAIRMILYYDKDQNIRIENTTPFGNPISSFVSSSNQIRLYDIVNNMLITGENKPEHFAKLIQIPLDSSELAGFIKCKLPVKIKDGIFYIKDSIYFFEAENSRFGWGKVKFNEKNLISEIDLKNEVESLGIKYLNYRTYNDILYPTRIIIETSDHSVTLNIRSIEFKDSIEDSVFDISVNKNAIRIYLDN